MLFADSNYHRVHNGFQYIHYEYNCQCIESCCAELDFLRNLPKTLIMMRTMPDRQKHQQEVHAFLQKHFSIHDCIFSLPRSSGMESYFAQGNGQSYFVKVGVQVERYLAMAEIGLTPPVLVYGQLDNGLSVMVQRFVAGRTPTRPDYRNQLMEVAGLIRKMHSHPRVNEVLQVVSSNFYKVAGLRALNRLCQKWECYKMQVPLVTDFVDNSLDYLSQ